MSSAASWCEPSSCRMNVLRRTRRLTFGSVIRVAVHALDGGREVAGSSRKQAASFYSTIPSRMVPDVVLEGRRIVVTSPGKGYKQIHLSLSDAGGRPLPWLLLFRRRVRNIARGVVSTSRGVVGFLVRTPPSSCAHCFAATVFRE